MAISLVNNLGSLESQQRLASTSSRLNNTLQRLSSGLRINSSGDDAAGLAIANAYRSDVSKLRQGVRNANDGVSTLQIIDGGLNTISQLVDRAGVLATQSASDTFSGNRDTLNSELQKVTAEISRQAQNIGLADGSVTAAFGRFNKALSVFIGGGTSADAANNTVAVNLGGTSNRVDAAGLGLDNLKIGTASTAAISGSNIAAQVAGPSGGITAAETLTFTVAGAASPVTVALAANDSASDIVGKINAAFTAAAVTGVTAATTAATDAAGTVTLTAAEGVNFSVSSNQEGVTGQSGLTGNNGGAIGAKEALNLFAIALEQLGSVQGIVGAGQNNLAQAIDLATAQVTNFQAAESRLRDADVAAEASDLSRLTTLQQAGISALAQANQSSQAVLSLLR